MVQKKIIHDVATGETTVVDYTAEEQATYDDYNSTEKVTARKLEQVKEFRLEKLKETDWYSNSDVTMPDNIKTYRQKMRDLPQDYTTEDEYDLLLARDEQGNLTHSVWEKP